MSKDKNKLGWETKYRRSKKWLIGLTTFLTASTGVTTGLAIYYATRPNVATVEVNFHVDDDGILTGGKTQKVIKGSKIGQLPVPVKEASKNQIFSHWVDFDGKQYKTSDEITTNIDVYAVYKEAGKLASTVTMELNGGVIEGLSTINQVLVIRGSVIASLPSPVIDGGIFSHWKTKDGTKISPAETIDGDMTVYAEYKDVSSSTYLVDGKTLVEVEPGKGGEIVTPWRLMQGKTEITGATWTVSLPAELPEGSVWVTDDGIVHWNENVPTGRYEVGISAEKGDVIGTTNFAVVTNDHTYSITGGFVSKTVFANSGTETVGDAWKVVDETGAEPTAVWDVAIAEAPLSQGSIVLNNDNKIEYNYLAIGTYNLTITAYKDDAKTKPYGSVKAILIAADHAYTMTGGVDTFKVNNYAYVSSAAFKLYRDEESEAFSNTTWTITNPDGTTLDPNLHISMLDDPIAKGTSKILCNSTPAGTYTTMVNAIVLGSIVSSKIVTIVSTASESVVIEGADTFKSSLTETYSAKVLPEETPARSQNINWTIKDWKGIGTRPQLSDPSTSVDDIEVSTSYDTIGTLILTATDTYSGKSIDKTIVIEAPYTNSNSVWDLYYDGSDYYWFEATMDDICDINNDKISFEMLIGGTTELEKKNILSNQNTFYIGDQITSIPDNFMIGKTGTDGWSFNNPIIFPGVSKCSVIGNNFLKDNTTFNSTITLPSTLNIKTIGNSFMDGCSEFNQDITIPSTVTIIGDDFMYGNSVFNHVITLPSKIERIGDSFLSNCVAFNQNITVPSSLNHVGKDFMENCDSLTKDVTMNVNPDVFDDPTSYTFATNNPNAASYLTGIGIRGAYAQDFIARFPGRTSEPYRTWSNTTGEQFEITTWDVIAGWAEAIEKNEKTIAQMCTYFGEANKDSFVGKQREIAINGKLHYVRVLEVQHASDLIADGSTTVLAPATFTFELETLLSDENGNVLTTKWDDEEGSNDYLNSTLRKNLTGQGKSDIQWYNSDGEEISETRSALEMLPNDLQQCIKTVQKSVWTHEADDKITYNDKLFPLTMKEMGLTNRFAEVEGSTYTHWSNNEAKPTEEERAAGRIKKDASTNAETYWLATTDNDDTNDAFGISYGGYNTLPEYYEKLGVSFGFCI